MEYGEQLSAATIGDLGVETHFQDGTPLDELKSHCLQLFPKTRAAFRSLELKLETLKPNDDELPRIEVLIEKLRGPNIIGVYSDVFISRFENYRIFEDLARRKVSSLETPAMTCLEEVTALVHNAFVEIAGKQFGRFQFLRYLVVEIVNELFQKLKEEARQELSRMNEAEKVIYSSDTTFTDCLDKFSNIYRFGQIELPSQLTQSGTDLEMGRELSGPSKSPRFANNFTLTEEQGIQSEGYRHSRQKATGGGQQMLRKLKAYFKIVSGRLSDAVPQVIMHNLFKKFPQQVKVKLISHFSKSQAVHEDKVDEKERSVHWTVDRLLQEDEDLTRHREELHHKVERLQEGERKLKSFLSTPYGMSS
ncbi:interferon-induced GTP-binding protein Mx-like isoform X2 [Corticium candelabrum]|uniref:interferon-induced GTP-binding protein Mx-like isoform X2 n=1 Tax=Corticium candelabrum TaxID=121492 RepID=UPI002E258836|nr:interferon-induced GTP-binding protein Mx-like isoform X2 [Corticium candelabrum]